uniref:Uncharacterized protein n=1 Tax=Ananas comosus var. bracteatus TaxID=296719 RepID=A0A6V7QGD0_ANACO|nr:unnamed protein product [Ananas comosus var. bracteatus]
MKSHETNVVRAFGSNGFVFICSAKSSGWRLDLENGLENFGAYAVDLRINEMSSGGRRGGEGKDVVLKWRGCVGDNYMACVTRHPPACWNRPLLHTTLILH